MRLYPHYLREWRQCDKSQAETLAPPTEAEIEEAMGEQVRKCERLAKNWRNRIYRVELASGVPVVAKQVVLRLNLLASLLNM